MSEKATAESSLRRFNRWDAAFFLAAFVFLYTQLFQLPFTPYYFEGDHLLPVRHVPATPSGIHALGIATPGGEVVIR